MGMAAWAAEMARYNQWQNEALFGLTDDLSDAERKQDRGMFFGSLHRTLNHILMVDERLLGLVESGLPPSQPFDPNEQIHADYGDLRTARHELDIRIVTLADGHADAWFDDVFVFTSPLTRQPRELPRHFYLVQLFNHATHHRSQITAAMHQMGIDYGSTDLPMNPISLY